MLPVPPAVVGVPEFVAAGAAVEGAFRGAGSFNLSPTLIRSVFRPLSDLSSVTDVLWAVAIFDRVSPVLITYKFSPPLVPMAATIAVEPAAGTTSFWPTFNCVELTPGLALATAVGVTPNFLAMV